MDFNIFIIDDEKLIRKSLEMTLNQENYRIEMFETGEEAVKRIKNYLDTEPAENISDLFYPDLALLDIRLPGKSGIDILKELKDITPDTLVIMITAYGKIEIAVEAIKLGAYDFIVKPFNNDQMRLTVQRALQNVVLKKQNLFLRQQMTQDFYRSRLIGSGAKMKNIISIVKRVAASNNSTILIEGESGTGKGLLAKTIHFQSDRFKSPFVTINCSAIPRDLLESELFGYEKGAFSGASPRGQIGKLEAADGGTVFLDEISDMDLSLQAKILNAVEERYFTRVGGITPVKTDIRIIAASNKNLQEKVQQKLFRNDLYHRLNVFKFELPPLRERREDILILANYFLEEYNKEWKKNKKGFTKEAQNKLMTYDWPGNIRELRNVVERSIVLDESDYITEEFLMLDSQKEKDKDRAEFPDVVIPPEGIDMDKVEHAYLIKALELTNGNQRKSARLLGINLGAFRYRLNKFKISPTDYSK